MTRLTCKVDQLVAIGREIVVVPTDIDVRIVRLLARGRQFGGPNDGASFESIHELSRGQSISVGQNIAIMLIDIAAKEATIGVLAPKGIAVALL